MEKVERNPKSNSSDWNAKVLSALKENFTSEIVKTIAKQAWSNDVEIINHELENYSDEKLGFLGVHCSLRITVLLNDELESKSFFTKLTPSENDLISDVLANMGVFKRECYFYSEVLPLLQSGYQGGRTIEHPVEPWGPLCFFVSEKITVLEDLRVKGFTIHNRMMNKAESMSALSAIARMHAASLLAEQKLGKSLPELSPRAFDMNLYYDENGFWSKWFRTGIDVSIALLQHFGLDSSRTREICEKVRKKSLGPSDTKRNAISHSDLWTNNIMLDESCPPKSLLVDYQMIRYCPIGWDFCAFLHLCTDREFRKRHKIELMRFYYDSLRTLVNRHSYETVAVPEWSEFEQSVQEYTFSAVTFALLYYPTSLLDGKKSAEVFRNTDGFMNIMFHDRKESTLMYMTQNSYYNERIKEAVHEFAELSDQFDRLPLPS